MIYCYPYSFWKEYKSTISPVKILSPTSALSINDTTSDVIPIVYAPNGDLSNYLIIYNISANSIIKRFDACKFTRNSQACMMSKDGNHIVGLSDGNDISELMNNRSKHLAKSLRSNSYISYLNSEKVLVIESTERSEIWGYSYTCIVPYDDITRQTYHILTVSILIMLALCVILTLYIILGSKTLYEPWKKLANVAENAYPNYDKYFPRNDYEDFIEKCFTDISLANNKLSHNYSRILPLSQERYLISVLNDMASDGVFETLSFKYDNFMSLCINIMINPKFEINNEEVTLEKLKHAIMDVVHNVFADSFITYRLPISSNNLYLLLNLKDDAQTDDIWAAMDTVNDILSFDLDNILITGGNGNIYSGYNGIKITHHEALSSLANKLSKTKIKFSPSHYHSVITNEHENMLLNYLTIGHIDKAHQLLDNIYSAMNEAPDEDKKSSYIEIINILEKVVNQKNLSINTDIHSSILDILRSNKTLDEPTVQSYISDILEQVAEIMATYSSKLDINAVIGFINENFCKDIVLEDIAEKFDTSTKYLSKRIKQYLGVPYKEYITRLRMDKSKELLQNTDITINELYLEVGFANRTAFTRAFKLSTGLSPSEYRSIHGKKK
ncbi:MAG: AraC family transcriptional regulator [Clostridiales bacterium]|nr:AraC family transcriptional regulator [Clostridiales bacterium]